MPRSIPSSPQAAEALAQVVHLQRQFAEALQACDASGGSEFTEVEWLRDGGRHGGGTRRQVQDTAVFDRASVNVSQVHYDDEPNKKLESATALSTIVHPRHPRAPSVHIHVSWTKLRGGPGYWRAMADLNPAIADEGDRRRFADAVGSVAPALRSEAEAQGDRYFMIPALGRHRGVYHYYLEAFATEDPAADAEVALGVGRAAIEVYPKIVADVLAKAGPATPAERSAQLAYHTLYLFQVLTLDRGTTSGLLIHRDNDIGILGSLPSHVDRERLAGWRSKVPAPQESLVDALVLALPQQQPSPIDTTTKQALADAVRAHYTAHPEALALQASGKVVPPTVANHR